MKLEWVRRVCDNKDKALFLISRLEGKKTIFNSRNDEYIVEFERECLIIDGEYTRAEEE